MRPPGEGASLERTMEAVQSYTSAWQISHLLTGFGYMASALGAVTLLTFRSRLTSGPVATTGWALIALFSLPLFL